VRSIYLDYNATTPLDPAVRETMLPCLGEVFGNPSSIHHIGRRARALLDDSRSRAAELLGCKPSEVIFTSGGTESNNLAIFGAAHALKGRGRHIITSAVEHHAVLHSCRYLADKEGYEVTCLPVDAEGCVSPDSLDAVIRPDSILVSIMTANNETGAIQPIAALGEICRKRGVLFHTDAVQWFGKMPIDSIHQFNADLVSICAHKFHGPKGAGLLFARSPFHPDPILFGGGHENERRAGTENVASIVGMTEALARFVKTPVFAASHLQPLSDRLIEMAGKIEGVHFRGSRTRRLNNTVALTVRGADSIALLAGLDLEGICASSGSACSAGSLEPSHVMKAMGVDDAEANSLVRFSLGRETTSAEIAAVEEVLPAVIKRIRR
jgi:cysteine desulfurase